MKDINNYHEELQLKALEKNQGLKSVKKKHFLGNYIIALKEDGTLINDLNNLIKRCEKFYLKLYSTKQPQEDKSLSITDAPPPPHILPSKVRTAIKGSWGRQQ